MTALRETFRDAIRRALGELTRGDLLIVLLAVDDGLSDVEIAEVLGCLEARVRSRRTTLMNRLRTACRAEALAATR